MLLAIIDAAFPAPLAGTDEVGRGALAGAVVAAAVILPETFPLSWREQLADSKKIPPQRRAAIAEVLHAEAHCAISAVDVATIDRINILQASLKAMQQAVAALPLEPAFVLIDGNKAPQLSIPHQTMIAGDSKSQAIAAASIIAKVYRDAMLYDLARQYPGYGFESHKGYGTAAHHAAIARLGLTPHHRRSFAPCFLHHQAQQTSGDTAVILGKISA